MKTSIVLPSHSPSDSAPTAREFARTFEMRLWITLLILCNLPLLGGQAAGNLILLPGEVAAGEWWRLFTSPFVHVGWYHLGLDAAAFLLLWRGLEERSALSRGGYFLGCWIGSLLLPWWIAPEIRTLGLCGLSGIAHGLMAVTAMEILRHPEGRRIGGLLLLGLLGKVAWELTAGAGLLAGWHIGDVGVPIPAAHAGGVLGGLAASGFLRGVTIFGQKGEER